ncbi:MAG: hypothetical protein ACXW1N_06770, partial [Halobacteriota archaeon]
LVGKAKDPASLAKIIRDCQSKGMLVIPTFDTIQQIKEAGIEIGEQKGLDRLLFCVGESTQAVHALSFAIRAALTLVTSDQVIGQDSTITLPKGRR